MAMFDDDIGRKIAVLRKACNVSATELSLAIGKKSHYIYGIEKGYFKPSTGAYFDICGYLGIPALIMTDSSLEEFEKIVSIGKQIEALHESEKEMVMEQFCSLVEDKISEALENKGV